MVAIGLFFAILAMGLTYMSVLTRPATSVGDVDLHSKASNILKVLTSSPGVPSDWEENPANMKRLGLRKPGTSVTMSAAKIMELQPDGGVTYQEAKTALGLDNHEIHIESSPKFQGDENRSALEGYRMAYIGDYDGSTESSTSQTESESMTETAVTFKNSLPDGSGAGGNPGDKFKDNAWWIQRHLTPRLAGLWFNDDGAITSSSTAWRVLDMQAHGQSLADANSHNRNILATSNWTAGGNDDTDDGTEGDDPDGEWIYADEEDDRIYAIKVDLSDYDSDDPVWLNVTHWVDGSGSFTTPLDHGEIQSRSVDSGNLDTWNTETSWAGTEGLVHNGTFDDFADDSFRLTHARGENSYISFFWDTTSTDTETDGGWFIANWTLEGIQDGEQETLATNTLDFENSRFDVLVAGQGTDQGQFSESPNDQDQVKDPIQQWIEAGGDVVAMSPGHGATSWLKPWIGGGSPETDGPMTLREDHSNTSHAYLTTPHAVDYKDWSWTNTHWEIDSSKELTWVLALEDSEATPEIVPGIGLTQQDATGDGDILLSSQDATAATDDQRRWFYENSLTIVRYRGLFLDFGDMPGGDHTVGSASSVVLVDSTDGSLNYPNYEIFVDAWR